MKVRDKVGLLTATVFLCVGCYSLAWTTVAYSTATAWTGTGRGTFYSSYNGRGVGLAGQQLVMLEGGASDGYGALVFDNPLGAYFSGTPYVLRSYTQTLGATWHQLAVLVAHPAGGSGGTDLFFQSGLPSAAGWRRAAPSSSSFWEAPVDAIAWTIVEICEVAAITRPDTVSSHRVFASVRARPCLGSCSESPRGGVVELQLEGRSTLTPSWRVVEDEYGLGNAAMRDENGYAFSNECMPFDVTTGYGDQARHRLVVADPSTDAILMYDVGQLRAGPVDVTRAPEASRSPVDIAVLGDREGGVDYVFVAALWRGSAAPALRHYVGTHRSLGDEPHLTESLSSDVQFIQAQLQGVTTTPEHRAQLYAFGNRAIRRTYEF